MAQRERTDPGPDDLNAVTRPGRNETAEGEHDRIRTSNDADQAPARGAADAARHIRRRRERPRRAAGASGCVDD